MPRRNGGIRRLGYTSPVVGKWDQVAPKPYAFAPVTTSALPAVPGLFTPQILVSMNPYARLLRSVPAASYAFFSAASLSPSAAVIASSTEIP